MSLLNTYFQMNWIRICTLLIALTLCGFGLNNFIPGPEFPGANTTPTSYSLGPKPQALVPFLDSTGGGTITRITDNDGSSTNVRHHYSSAQAFNADQTVIYMSKGSDYLDATTYSQLPYGHLSTGSSPIWSTIHPKEVILAKDSTVYRWDVTTNSAVKAFNLPGYKEAQFHVRMHISNDATKAAVVAKRKSDDSFWAVGIDLNTGAIGPEISYDTWNFSDLIGPTKDRRASASPTGKYIILQGTADGEHQRTLAFDWDTGAHVYSSPLTNGIECPGGHGDLAIDVNGRDVFVGICKGGGIGPSAIHGGETVIMDFESGTITTVPGVGYYSHYSGRNTRRDGWVYASTYKTTSSSSRSRILAFRTDGSKIEHYADPQGYRHSYVHETHATPSPDGTKILFSSSWNGIEAADVSNDYLLDLSKLAPEVFQTDINVWLEGTYDLANNTMTTEFQSKNLLPMGQPYSVPPWNYQGCEGQGWIASNYPAGTTDWVKVDFRSTPDPLTHLLTRAALLMNDGSLHFPIPITSLDLPNINSVYILIEHRNHLPALTSTPVSITNGLIAFDFRSNNSYVVGASHGQKEVAPGIWALFAGDTDKDDPAGYEISGLDRLIFNVENGNYGTYNIADHNLDGDVNGNDKIYWHGNNGVFSGVSP